MIALTISCVSGQVISGLSSAFQLWYSSEVSTCNKVVQACLCVACPFRWLSIVGVANESSVVSHMLAVSHLVLQDHADCRHPSFADTIEASERDELVVTGKLRL